MPEPPSDATYDNTDVYKRLVTVDENYNLPPELQAKLKAREIVDFTKPDILGNITVLFSDGTEMLFPVFSDLAKMMQAHIESTYPHAVYDTDIPDLTTLFENQLI